MLSDWEVLYILEERKARFLLYLMGARFCFLLWKLHKLTAIQIVSTPPFLRQRASCKQQCKTQEDSKQLCKPKKTAFHPRADLFLIRSHSGTPARKGRKLPSACFTNTIPKAEPWQNKEKSVSVKLFLGCTETTCFY